MKEEQLIADIGDVPYNCRNPRQILAEYLWIDGTNERAVRGKPKVLEIPDGTAPEKFRPPIWGFDGSSTEQAKTKPSDCILVPVQSFYDPFRNTGAEALPHILVLCEVFGLDKRPHPTNTRAHLRQLAGELKDDKWLFGIEQEFTFYRDGRPMTFPKGGVPDIKQGPYYCGVGADRAFGRPITEAHYRAMLAAGVKFSGGNLEVMPGQHEYQIGTASPLDVADHLTVARYLMHRIGEDYDVVASLKAKPHPDWNGAGAHTNFSTKAMREGAIALEEVIARLAARHIEHIGVYGEGIRERLTSHHETSSCDVFSWGESDRGASIRVPWQVVEDGKGYLEDRRPCANIDPYVVCAKIMETVGRT